jgi:hypothetical protein
MTQPEIVDIGSVAAANIAARLKLDEKRVPEIKRAIADEINAMSSHFSLAFADVQTQYEAEVAKVKSAWSYVRSKPGIVAGTLGLVFLFGAVLGAIVGFHIG